MSSSALNSALSALVANREAKASRGRVLISKEFVSGAPVLQDAVTGPSLTAWRRHR